MAMTSDFYQITTFENGEFLVEEPGFSHRWRKIEGEELHDWVRDMEQRIAQYLTQTRQQ